MRLHYLLIVAIWLLQSSMVIAEEKATQILVVTNVESVGELNKKQIKQIYLEGGINFPVKPVTISSGAKIRSVFNAKVIGLTDSRIKAYWAQMKFTGRASPPKELASVEEVIKFLNDNPGYIAYIPASTKIPEKLHVVYSINY